MGFMVEASVHTPSVVTSGSNVNSPAQLTLEPLAFSSLH